MAHTTPAASATDRPDVLVVGLGAMGSATLLHAARAGVRALGIDRLHPPHTMGSSHGESRITRLAIGEGADYVPLVHRSHEIWRELETESGESLYHACGGLVIGPGNGAGPMHGQADFLGQTIALAGRHGIAHERLDADRIAARWPQFQLRGDERGYFEPSAGYLRPEACIATQLALAQAAGAQVRGGERLLSWRQEAGGTVILTDRRSYRPGIAVFCLGPWLAGILARQVAGRADGAAATGPALPPLRVTRQHLHWFGSTAPGLYAEQRFPIFIWNWGTGAGEVFYGFPDLGRGVKVATEADTPADPELALREPDPGQAETMYRQHVHGRLRALDPARRESCTCLYTEIPAARFWIDRLDTRGPLIVSACSGHGFKHSAAIGEAVARWALSGARPSVLAPFAAR